MGRTGIDACGESVSRHNSSELVVLFSLKQEASASIGGGTFTKCKQSFSGFTAQIIQHEIDHCNGIII